LLKVALDDPTLFHEKPETEKCDFMAELGMRTVGKTEKASKIFSLPNERPLAFASFHAFFLCRSIYMIFISSIV